MLHAPELKCVCSRLLTKFSCTYQHQVSRNLTWLPTKDLFFNKLDFFISKKIPEFLTSCAEKTETRFRENDFLCRRFFTETYRTETKKYRNFFPHQVLSLDNLGDQSGREFVTIVARLDKSRGKRWRLHSFHFPHPPFQTKIPPPSSRSAPFSSARHMCLSFRRCAHFPGLRQRPRRPKNRSGGGGNFRAHGRKQIYELLCLGVFRFL